MTQFQTGSVRLAASDRLRPKSWGWLKPVARVGSTVDMLSLAMGRGRLPLRPPSSSSSEEHVLSNARGPAPLRSIAHL
eukprot:scaffold286814_cov22-Tisochrysis_lutea.AAC.1